MSGSFPFPTYSVIDLPDNTTTPPVAATYIETTGPEGSRKIPATAAGVGATQELTATTRWANVGDGARLIYMGDASTRNIVNAARNSITLYHAGTGILTLADVDENYSIQVTPGETVVFDTIHDIDAQYNFTVLSRSSFQPQSVALEKYAAAPDAPGLRQTIFGTENLAFFRKRLIGATTTPVTSNIVFTGDSTTAGNATTSPYRLWELVPETAKRLGIRGVVGINRGQSGKNTQDWINTYLAEDLAASPHLLIWHFGANDAPTRTPAQFEADLRTGLTTIRTSLNVTQLSVLLLTPNAMNDTPNNRYAAWFETIDPIIRKAAVDFSCAFADVYAVTRDMAFKAGFSYDDPYGDGRGVHPYNETNVIIADLISEAIFPRGLGLRISDAQNVNVSGNFETRTPQSALTAYEPGVSQYRALGGSPAWPYDGCVITHRFADSTAYQVNYGYQDVVANKKSYAVRVYNGSSWGGFTIYNGAPTAVTAASGFALPGSAENAAVALNGDYAFAAGYVSKSSPSPIAAGTLICTIPAAYRPINYPAYGVQMAVWDNSLWEFPRARILADGTVTLLDAVSINATRVYFGPANWWIK